MERHIPSDMIDLFLDGELPQEQRSELFAALAESDELQAEFHQALIIRLAALRQASALVPPPALTQAILSAAVRVPQSATNVLSRLWRSASLRSAVLTAVVGAVGFFIGRMSMSSPQSIAPPTLLSRATVQNNPLSLHAPSPTQVDVTIPHTTTSARSRHLLAEKVVQMPQDTTTIHAVIVQQPRRDTLASLLHQALYHPFPFRRGSDATLLVQSDQVKHRELFSRAINEATLTLGIRHTSSLYIRQSHLVQALSSTPITNAILSVEYREPTVGYFIEAGYEQFPIYEVTQYTAVPAGSTLSTSSSQNQFSIYTLQQMLGWVALGMRSYIPLGEQQLSSPLYGVLGIALGTSRYGVLGRGQLGIVVEPVPKLGLQLLLEGMVHSHGVRSQWEHAEKLSTSFGLVYRF